MTYNVLGLMLGAACLMTGSTAFAQPVKILSAVYGTPQAMRTCDAGPAVSSICTGHSACSVPIGNTLCGDPDFLAVKTIAITYSCGRRVQRTTTPERSVARIACQ